MATVLDRSALAKERPSIGQLIRARRPGHMLPADFYLRQDVFEVDLELLFRRQWLFVGVAGDVPEPGDAFTVDIGDTSVGDVGFNDLKNMSRLEWLDMHGTQITDAGLTNLKKLFGLRTLYLNGTKVTDKGLMNLIDLQGLTELHLNVSLVTKAGVQKFQALRPKCKVSY